jgi:hypothetical protein
MASAAPSVTPVRPWAMSAIAGAAQARFKDAEALGSRADAAEGQARVGHGSAVRFERQDGGDAERGALVDAELEIGPRRAGVPGRRRTAVRISSSRRAVS